MVDVCVAIAADSAFAEDLDRCLDEPGKVEDDEHEGEEQHEAGEEASLDDEDVLDDHEDDC